jgi:Fe2+ or Zn2+ uptake regulation protein
MKKCQHRLCIQAKNHSLPEDSYRAILKEKGIAITKPRLSILKFLMAHSLPVTVEDLHLEIGKTTCDLATVYRVLTQYMEVKIVNAIHLEKDLVHYEYNNPLHHHHHVICNSCKKVELIEDCFINDLEQSLLKKGYKDIGHQLQFFGTCKACAS